MQTECLPYNTANRKYIFDCMQSWSWKKEKEKKMTLNLFQQLNSFIQFYFVQAGAAGLKNQISKTNQPYDAQPCWLLLFSPLHFIGIFFFLPSLLKLQLSRHKGPHGPDQMFQAAHFPTLCLMEYSWATRHRSTAQHSTAPHRPETTYLLISSPCCLADWGTTTAQCTRRCSHLSASHRPHPPSLTGFLLIGTVLMDT